MHHTATEKKPVKGLIIAGVYRCGVYEMVLPRKAPQGGFVDEAQRVPPPVSEETAGIARSCWVIRQASAAVLALLRRESGFRWPDTRCDAVVGRWTLGSGVLAHTLNLADPHWLLARSGDPCRPDLHTDSPRSNANTAREVY